MYAGELILCEGLVQAREDHISQTNIEPVHYNLDSQSITIL